MDTLQLNKINELAREYLRLGIAKGTTDAVEKARFQLAFETHKQPVSDSPYDSLFASRQKESSEQSQVHETRESLRDNPRELSPLDVKTTRIDAIEGRIGTLESHTQERLRTQQARIAQLEEMLSSLKREIATVRDTAARAPTSQATAPQMRDFEPRVVQNEAPIASTIEQTIKGRTISSADVSVDKIFYFGNR